MDNLVSTWTVGTFYRFVRLDDLPGLQSWFKGIAASHGILGTILLAEEGVNSTIAGPEGALPKFFAEIGQDARFKDMEVKYSASGLQPFRKLRIRLKKEIVRMKQKGVRPDEGVGAYVEPENWNDLIRDPNVRVIDVRNVYETEVGTFEGAEDPRTGEFWEFPDYARQELQDKDQPLALFCTGGIRCEKATAYLVREGYTNVSHLHGGILKYLEEVPKAQSLWRGECFIFDHRRGVDHDLAPTGGHFEEGL